MGGHSGPRTKSLTLVDLEELAKKPSSSSLKGEGQGQLDRTNYLDYYPQRTGAVSSLGNAS